MTTYCLVLVKDGVSPGISAMNDRHETFVADLERQRRVVARGPFQDGGEIREVMVVTTASDAEARSLVQADPAVKSGHLAIEVLPFMAPEGWFHVPPAPASTETLYFGFLNSGPNRSQDTATAERLQNEHLGYMGSQHKAGRLVMAGPFVNGGAKRGIVVYRLKSLDEARTYAEGDPMVKAGRLAVELHPWQLAKGVLK